MTDRFEDAVQRIVLWGNREGPALGRVICPSSIGRERAWKEVKRRLARPVVEVELPLQSSARATAAALEAVIETGGSAVISVAGWEALGALTPAQVLDVLGAIVLRRERLAALPGRQIWWLPPGVAQVLATRAVDLDDWFTLRTDLPEEVHAVVTAPVRPRLADRPVAEAKAEAQELARRFTLALERGDSATGAWGALAVPAVKALRGAGLTAEADALHDRLAAALAQVPLPTSQASAETQTDIFVSHASSDLNWAEWISETLIKAGFTVRLDAWDFRPGSDFILEMNRATEQCRATLVVLSPNFIAARFTAPEWAAAFRRDPSGQGGTVIPVRVAAVRPEDLKGLLGGRVWIDLVDLEEPDAARLLAEKVRHALQGGRARPTTPRRFPGAAATAPAIAWPGAMPSVWNIPPATHAFVGREKELHDLDRVGEGAVVLTQAVVGLGGVGKSTLARRWAHLHSAEVSLGWWLRGEHPGTFEEDLLGLGRALGLLDANAAIEDRPAALASVRAWLRSPTPLHRVAAGQKRWLLIIDNAGDPASIDLPVGPGTVVVTSRDRRWERSVAGFKVNVLPTAASRDLLRAGLTGPGNTDADADALALKLGHLPLALAQAHAWCHENGQPLARCLARLETPSSAVLRFPAGTGEATVASTWSLLVEGLAPASRALLEVLAFFGSDDIPVESLFVEGLEKSVAGLSAELVSLCEDPDALDLALQPLHRMCLVERRGDRLDIHRLVQRVTRESLSEEGRQERLREAQGLLLRGMPDPQDPAGWPLWRRLVPHLEGLVGGEPQMVGTLAGDTAAFLYTQAAYPAARRLTESALALMERALGPDHPDTAVQVGNLAATLSALGEYQAAKPLQERALAMTERALGHDHPSTARCLGNLAATLFEIGDYAATRVLEERALEICERTLGPDHPETALRLGNLALTMCALAQFAEGRRLAERALAATERALGPDHPETATQLNNLAQALSGLEDHAAARPLLARALTVTERTLGPNHPVTADRLSNLGLTLTDLGDNFAARQLHMRALEIAETALGPDHPETATFLNNLAQTLSALKEDAVARPMLERALSITERSLGPDHPATAVRLNNLGATLFALGDHAAARPLAERALAITKRALGPDHPDTVLRRTNLVSVLSALGDHEAARKLHPPSASPSPGPTTPSTNRAARRAAGKRR